MGGSGRDTRRLWRAAHSVAAFAKKRVVPEAIRAAWRSVSLRYKVFTGGLYDERFCDAGSRQATQRGIAPIVVSTLVDMYAPRSVLDLGCGDGVYLEQFVRRGVAVMGYDISAEAIRRCRLKGIPATRFDIRRDVLDGNDKCDLAICIEVAEHIPARASDRLVSLLCQCSDTIVFTAAPPGQGGLGHVNEQPYASWVGKFRERGHELAREQVRAIRDSWQDQDIIDRLIANLMVFSRTVPQPSIASGREDA